MAGESRTYVRPRGQAWGNEAQRAVLHAIAEDVARRSGHRVAAIEVLRSDDNLEFVAIAGDSAAREELLGRASPLSLHHLVGLGTPIEGWLHIPGERLSDDARAWMEEYGHIPDVPRTQTPGGWDPDDQMVRLLASEAGDLRALLYLDEPLSGMRPTPETVRGINAEVEVLLDAVVTLVERERFGAQVRMLAQARTAMQSVPHGLGVGDFIRELSDAMVEAMAVDSVDVLLAGHEVAELDPHTAVLEDHMHRVWLRRGHLVLEPTQTWGITDSAVPTPPVMARVMERRGLGSWLLVPIGMGEDYLGTMGLGRAPGGARWTDSEIIAASVVASDVAGVVVGARLMERERRLNARLRDISDHRRDMVMTLAHELRNPVSVLWTHLEMVGEMVQDLGAAFVPIEGSLAAMTRSTRRIADMVEDLMALATVSDPERQLPRAPVDLAALVRESVDFLGAMADHAEVALDVDVVDGLVVPGEVTGLQRVVTNLVTNAIKYTPAGGRVSLSVAAAVVDDTPGVRLTCVDTGIGIDAAERDHVFTPFYRSSRPEARRQPGTGLGLAIVERVVLAHGGSVEVESELGSGTTFRVWLPTAEPVDVR